MENIKINSLQTIFIAVFLTFFGSCKKTDQSSDLSSVESFAKSDSIVSFQLVKDVNLKLPAFIEDRIFKSSLNNLNSDLMHFKEIGLSNVDSSIVSMSSEYYLINSDKIVFKYELVSKPSFTDVTSIGIYDRSSEKLDVKSFYEVLKIQVKIDEYEYSNGSIKIKGKVNSYDNSEGRKEILMVVK